MFDGPCDCSRTHCAEPFFQFVRDESGAVRRHSLVYQSSDLIRFEPAGEQDTVDAEFAKVVVLEFSGYVGVGDDREAGVILVNGFDFGACLGPAGVVRVNDTSIDRFFDEGLVQCTPRRTHDDFVRSPEGGDQTCRGPGVGLEDG